MPELITTDRLIEPVYLALGYYFDPAPAFSQFDIANTGDIAVPALTTTPLSVLINNFPGAASLALFLTGVAVYSSNYLSTEWQLTVNGTSVLLGSGAGGRIGHQVCPSLADPKPLRIAQTGTRHTIEINVINSTVTAETMRARFLGYLVAVRERPTLGRRF